MLLSRQFSSLHFAVRPRVIVNHLAQMSLLIAILSLVPASVTAIGENWDGVIRYGVVIGGMAVFGLLGTRLKVRQDLQRNEALVISALVFTLTPLAMTIPMMGYGIGFVDAFFETVSGVTTTGLSSLPTVEDKPTAFLFARAWLQWVGGLGVIVLAVAMILTPGAATSNLGYSEREADDIVGGTKSHARKLLIIYSILTLGGIAGIWAAGAAPFDALVNALAAISTGGFANHDASLGAYPGLAVALATSVVCFLGALPFYLFYQPIYRDWRQFIQNRQLRMLAGFCIAGTAALFLIMPDNIGGSPLERLGHAAVTVISAQSTAGFSTVPISDLGTGGVFLLVVLMMIGGGIGSTAGGIKLYRFSVMVRLMLLCLMRASVPSSSRIHLRFDKARVLPEELEAVIAVFVGYLLTVLISWMIFLLHGMPALPSLFEIASATGTAGLSVGITAPDLPDVLKLVLCVDMILGRVETVAIVVLLFPWTWIGRRRNAK